MSSRYHIDSNDFRRWNDDLYDEAWEAWLEEPEQSWIYEDHEDQENHDRFKESEHYRKALIKWLRREIRKFEESLEQEELNG